VGDISTVGRNTKGVKVMEVEDGDAVASVTVLPDGSEEAGADIGDPDDGSDDEATGTGERPG
jgi:DNA gyrase subunit A